MRSSVAIIGYGSIGKRHYKLLKKNKLINKVIVMSNQTDLPFKTYKNIQQIIKENPDYYIIASDTSKHFKQLCFLEENLSNKTILVEKPIFENYKDFKIKKNNVFVGYNLRFHPIVKMIKQKITNREIWNINVISASFLPEWRTNIDYKLSASASKKKGGGVLLDLSHEIDYLQWFFGDLYVDHVFNDKISNLKINVDDILVLFAKTKNSAKINLTLNYFSRKSIRQIIIDGKEISIQADLIKNEIFINENGKLEQFSWKNYNINNTYLEQHNLILNKEFELLCSYKEAIKTMKLIDKIRNFKK